MRCRVIAAALICMTALAGIGRGARAETVDLLLVLAADVSRSTDDDEFNLQRKGYANAITDPRGAERDYGREASRDRGHVCRMVRRRRAESRRRLDRRARRGGSGLDRLGDHGGAALICWPHRDRRGDRLRGAAICDGRPRRSERRIIDVSGDGTNNSGRPVNEARDEAVAAGITINGLAIINNRAEPGLRIPHEPAGRIAEILPGERDRRSRCISDRGLEDFHSFADAITRKLISEIAGIPDAGSRRLAGLQ